MHYSLSYNKQQTNDLNYHTLWPCIIYLLFDVQIIKSSGCNILTLSIFNFYGFQVNEPFKSIFFKHPFCIFVLIVISVRIIFFVVISWSENFSRKENSYSCKKRLLQNARKLIRIESRCDYFVIKYIKHLLLTRKKNYLTH